MICYVHPFVFQSVTQKTGFRQVIGVDTDAQGFEVFMLNTVNGKFREGRRYRVEIHEDGASSDD